MAAKKKPAKKKPAKKRKPKKRKIAKAKAVPQVFDNCGGDGCEISHRASRVSTKMGVYPGFSYTTPNAINEDSPIKVMTSKEKKAYGCKYRMEGPTGKRTVWLDDRVQCKTKSNPCQPPKKGEMRKTCPVQLIFRDGQPMLRFCRTPNKAGFVQKVDNHAEAQRLAAEACKCWEKTGTFNKCDVVNELALGGGPTTSGRKYNLSDPEDLPTDEEGRQDYQAQWKSEQQARTAQWKKDEAERKVRAEQQRQEGWDQHNALVKKAGENYDWEPTVSISRIDDDEWSWSVTREPQIKPGQRRNYPYVPRAEILAEGVEYSRAEAQAEVKEAVERFDLKLDEAAVSPL